MEAVRGRLILIFYIVGLVSSPAPFSLCAWIFCQSTSSRNSLVVLQLRSQGLPREDAQNRIASFWKARMGNIDSRVSPLCILQAAIVSGTAQSNSTLAFFLKQLTLVTAGAIFSRISGLSVVSPQVQQCLEIKHLALVESLPVTSHSYTHMHGQL